MSRSYRKYPICWVCCYSSKKDKIAYNRCFRHKDKMILKDYDDNTVLLKKALCLNGKKKEKK